MITLCLNKKVAMPQFMHLVMQFHKFIEIYFFQGIFSVIRRHSEIYLYVRIEKVLQGPISQSVEPYLKGSDFRTGSKVYKQMKQFCSNIGHHRMPFGWSAR